MNTVEALREDTGGGSDAIKADLQERMMARYMTPIEDVVSGPKLLADAQEPQRASTRSYLEDGLTTVWTEHVQDVLANEPVRRDDSLVSKVYEIGKKSVNDTIDQWFYDPFGIQKTVLDAISPLGKVGKIQRAGKTLLGKAAKRVGEDVAHKAGSSRAGGSAPSTSKPSAPDGARSAAPGKQPAPQSSATRAPARGTTTVGGVKAHRRELHPAKVHAHHKKIIGHAQVTGTPGNPDYGHAIKTYRFAIEQARKPEVVAVLLNRGYNRLPGVRIRSNRRPDVIVVKKDGSIHVHEVASKSDKLSILQSRNKEAISKLPKGMKGKYTDNPYPHKGVK